MNLETTHQNELEAELRSVGLPQTPMRIVSRMVQFTTAITGEPLANRMHHKRPETCSFDSSGITLLSVDGESLEASFATPLTFVSVIHGLSYSSQLGFLIIHIHPLHLESHGVVNGLSLIGENDANLRFENDGDENRGYYRGKFKLL